MDHILNGLRDWLDIWEEQLKNEIEGEEHQYKENNIRILKDDIKAIKKAISAISSRC